MKQILKALGIWDYAKTLKKAYLHLRRKPYFKCLSTHYDESTSFIANNCFGGRIPQDLGMKYNSPTEGLFICYPDYIEFLSDFQQYTMGGVNFRKRSKSDMVNQWLDTLPHQVPIGFIPNGEKEVEIIFLHYHSEQEAREKWERRCKRINHENLVVFGSDNDNCTRQDAIAFLNLPFKNKIFLSAHDWDIPNSSEYCFIKEMEKDGKVNGYDKAHLVYKYLCKYKLNSRQG